MATQLQTPALQLSLVAQATAPGSTHEPADEQVPAPLRLVVVGHDGDPQAAAVYVQVLLVALQVPVHPVLSPVHSALVQQPAEGMHAPVPAQTLNPVAGQAQTPAPEQV